MHWLGRGYPLPSGAGQGVHNYTKTLSSSSSLAGKSRAGEPEGPEAPEGNTARIFRGGWGMRGTRSESSWTPRPARPAPHSRTSAEHRATNKHLCDEGSAGKYGVLPGFTRGEPRNFGQRPRVEGVSDNIDYAGVP
jgi:hypothetical protein